MMLRRLFAVRHVRKWFRAEDGTYYRNINLILAEQKELPWWHPAQPGLSAEWNEAWREGLIRKTRLGRGDIEATPRPMREVYPQYPIFWTLDGSDKEPTP